MATREWAMHQSDQSDVVVVETKPNLPMGSCPIHHVAEGALPEGLVLGSHCVCAIS